MRFCCLKKVSQIQQGSSVLKMLDKSKLSLLDLFVRESVQNSFDALDLNNKYLISSFYNGKFKRDELLSFIPEVADAVKKICENNANFICVRDYNTTGINGDIGFDSDKDSNFNRLIYENGNPQVKAGSGGSWGYGKIIHFLLGVGIVIFYTKIKNANNKYESRLIIQLMENEKNKDSLLNRSNQKKNIGIAYWGEDVIEKYNICTPITDESTIKKVLSVFSIEPYSEDKIGTSIIIPFVNYAQLIEDYNNRFVNDEKIKIDSIESAIRNTVYKWFSLKIDNTQSSPYIKFYLNNDAISYSDAPSAFKVLQEMYNYCYEADSIDNTYAKQQINIKSFLNSTNSGTLVSKIFTEKEMGILPPINDFTPYAYYNCGKNDNSNPPIILFCRKPGMIINYESTLSEWLKGVDAQEIDKFSINLFVLNSINTLREKDSNGEETSIEEYVRGCEFSNHNSWQDKDGSCKLISAIKNRVSINLKKLNNKANSISHTTKTSMGRYYASIFLPKLGYGTLSSIKVKNSPKKNSNEKFRASQKAKHIKLDLNNKKFEGEYIIIPAKVVVDCPVIHVTLAIESGSSVIEKKDWEDISNEKFPLLFDNQNLIIGNVEFRFDDDENKLTIRKLSNDIKNETEFLLKFKVNDNKYQFVLVED